MQCRIAARGWRRRFKDKISEKQVQNSFDLSREKYCQP